MKVNKLKFNPNKAEVLVVGPGDGYRLALGLHSRETRFTAWEY